MKKYLFIIGMTAVMFAACSSNDGLPTQNVADEEAVDEGKLGYEYLVGTTPIEFAGVSVAPTAEFEVEEITRGNATGVSENMTLGIYCLSYKVLNNSIGESYLYWKDNATYKTLNRWQDNAKAHIVFNTASDGVICWDDPDAPHYYPKYDYFAYQFAAYQPYTDIVECSNLVTAWIPLDGDDDIMYAVSEGPRNGVVDDELAAYAYGNHYFSEVAAAPGGITADHKPYFTFRHLLAQMVFNIKLKEGAETSGHTFRVDSISIRNLTEIARLYIANKNGSGTIESGQLVCFGDVNSSSIDDDTRAKLQAKGVTGRRNFWLREKDGSSIRDLKVGNDYKYLLTTTAKTIGNGIFIPTSSGTLTIDVFLCDENGNRFTSSAPIKVTKPTSGWKAGKHYPIPITVTPPKYFMDDTRGTVIEWQNDTEVTVDEIDAEF